MRRSGVGGRRCDHSLSPLHVERLWRQVQIPWPDNGAELLIEAHLGEGSWIAQRCEHAAPLRVVERDVSDGSVFEHQAQLVISDHGDADDVRRRSPLATPFGLFESRAGW
jgi:hypothetical protein